MIAPSECYETFGRVVIESFSLGTPVIVSDIGAIGELVADGFTGLKFEAGNATALRESVLRFFADEGQVQQMRTNALKEHRDRYTADHNYPMLMEAYERAIEVNSRS